ncbi:FadR/GntR family transcriptional regulator [Roseibium sp.]|uniref:FadR/GntR family transcriptional regulator n=1 Tax=Roseibium sp. TaxID=1936156 RepID=UPI003A9719BD
MLTRPEQSDREEAITALRDFIVERSFKPGDRLPAERELIVDLGMTRTTLRKALDSLEREGAIWRHVGKGTFVASQAGAEGPDSFSGLAQQMSPVKMIRARLSIEPALAGEAAFNASREAIIRIRTAMERSEAAETWEDYETQDDLFHRAIAEAADNILLLSLFDQLNRVRRAVAISNVVRSSVRPARDHTSFAEHIAIAEAIEAHNSKAAYDAMRRHIGSVSARLFGED